MVCLVGTVFKNDPVSIRNWVKALLCTAGGFSLLAYSHGFKAVISLLLQTGLPAILEGCYKFHFVRIHDLEENARS
jgi:hypothetical protein